MFTIKREEGEATIVRLQLQRFDGAGARDIQRELEAIVEEKPKVLVLNFEEVDFITSFGISILLLVNKKLKVNGGTLRVAALNELIDEAFRRAKLDQIIPIFRDVESAIG